MRIAAQKGIDVKKVLIVLLIVLPVLTLLGVIGVFLFRHFVAGQIMDWGGMENPDAGPEEERQLDGDYTYVANELLLDRIAGTWESTDGRWRMTLSGDYGITMTLDGDTVLADTLEFTYLQPGEVLNTELRLLSREYALRRTDGSTAGEIFSMYHESAEDDEHGKICMEITDEGADIIAEEADTKMIEFRQRNTEQTGSTAGK